MESPIIEIEQGKLKGKIGVDYEGNNFYMFQGIPYAKPPFGELRFKAPQPLEPWSGIFDATQEGSECVSKHILFQHNIGSEDCLHLNVYTPELPNEGSSKPKPVMVWIHGGNFVTGSNKTDVYGPEFLITEDVVIVAINYRLGILGFLSLEDTSLGVSGNAGLKDMVLALKWVQKNIDQFNGDPNNVTIFGESAGAAACHFLMLSNQTKGLFHRVIMQSGVALCPWAIGLRRPIQIVESLGKHAKNEEEALNILRAVPAMDFIEAQSLINYTACVSEMNIIAPVIENPNPDAFITEHPMDIMLSGNYNKVPVIIGYNSREGIILDLNNRLVLQKKTKYRPNDFQDTIPHYYNLKKDSSLSKSIALLIDDFYYGCSTSPDESDDIDCFYTLNTDTFIARSVHLTVRALLKTLGQPIYFYTLNLQTKLNIYKNLGKVKATGACHVDDIGYLFKTVLTPEIKPNSQEEIAMRRMVKLWTNFAKTGNPNPVEKDSLIDIKWPEVTNDKYCSINLDKKLSIEMNPEQRRMRFWDSVSKKVSSVY